MLASAKRSSPSTFACFWSPVLKAAFNSNFVEGQTQKFRLQDTTERALMLLNDWLYTQNTNIVESQVWDRQRGIPEFNANSDQDNAMVELWVLAEKLIIPRLQNQVIEKFRRYASCRELSLCQLFLMSTRILQKTVRSVCLLSINVFVSRRNGLPYVAINVQKNC